MMDKESQGTHSIFDEPWWLDATAPGNWDAVEVEENGRVVARLPFVFRKKFGLRILGQPNLTQTLGPWIAGLESSESKNLARQKDLFRKLIRKLPKFDVFQQNFHSNITNWLPFYWEGFSQSTRYSYVLTGLNDLDRVFQTMDGSTRYDIRKAEKKIHVQEQNTVDQIIEMASLTFRRQGLKLPYDPELLHRIDEATKVHGERRAFCGVDEEGRVHSAIYIVGDRRRAYNLVTGADPKLRGSSSGSLLMWEAIKASADFTDVFDFEGSMIEGVEKSFRSFGPSQVPYFAIRKNSAKAERLESLRRFIRA